MIAKESGLLHFDCSGYFFAIENMTYNLHCMLFVICKDDLKSSSSAISSSIQSVSTPCMRRVRLGSRLPYTSLSSSTYNAWGVAQNTTSRVRNRFDPLPTTSCRPRPYTVEQQALLLFRLGTDSIPQLALSDSKH
jgi:hypothetical protein